ncbi:TIGR02922 family protein [Thalassotalea sp. G2M2-11]|uniref:TIGR02922 family protein n=1 Tax=Thalassotalea sp. G2M2-11 TaxID=2787627 RepID=UPI0019D12391
MEQDLRQVTIIYYSDISLELLHEVKFCRQNANGRVIIPEEFKRDKSIIAVCDGKVNILNKFGDRIQNDETGDHQA